VSDYITKLQIIDHPDELRVQFPPARSPLVFLNLFPVLLVVVYIGIKLFQAAQSEQITRSNFLVFLFFSFGAVLLAHFVFSNFLWNIFGRETFILLAEFLVLRYQIGSSHWEKIFDCNEVKNIRLISPLNPYGMDTRGDYSVSVGRIAFDSGGKTYRFGDSLRRSDASMLKDEIKKRLSRE
jgi:hypothetical protein